MLDDGERHATHELASLSKLARYQRAVSYRVRRAQDERTRLIQSLPQKVVVFVNTFTLTGAGTYPPGVYVVETMEARLAKPGVHSPNSMMAIMLPTSNLSTLRVEAEASELEAALARDREAGETKT